LFVDLFGHAQSVFYLHAGNKPGTDPNPQVGAFAEAAQRAIVRESDKEGAKKWHPVPLPEQAILFQPYS
jgi:hypothetical protein